MSRAAGWSPPETGRPASHRWLIPLLWIALPTLAAVVSWAWQHQLAPGPPPPPRPAPPLLLTGDARRDRRAILERAADLLLPPGSTTNFIFPGEYLSDGNPSLVEIGLELLPLDPARGTEIVRRVIQMTPVSASTGPPGDEADAPDRTHIGMLVHLARSLRQYPPLAAEALQAAYQETASDQNVEERIDPLCVFAREAADIDPARARSALQQAEATVAALPITAPADPFAAVAAAAARVEGAAAARPLVDRALRSIPSGAARPLVEARLAARLVNAAPTQARTLAWQALSDVERRGGRSGAQLPGSSSLPESPSDHPRLRPSEQKYFGRSLSELRVAEHRNPRPPQPPKPRARRVPLALQQYRDVAVTLAGSHPDAALAAVQRLGVPAERAEMLVEMARACEAGAPARAEAYYRRALRAAEALPPGFERTAAISNSAIGLAAYDLTAARRALSLASVHLQPYDVMMLGVRAVGRQPVAAMKLMEKARKEIEEAQVNNPPPSAPPGGFMPGAPVGVIPGYSGGPSPAIQGRVDEAFLPEVSTEPDLRRALSLAQQGESPEPEASALVIVARRLKQYGER